jgi:hypothetical protein
MTIQTLATIRRARARADRHRCGAAGIIAKMRRGATLHLQFSSSGPTWMLSDGTKVAADIAKTVISNLNVVGVGDCLFPRATAVSQTFRWIGN